MWVVNRCATITTAAATNPFPSIIGWEVCGRTGRRALLFVMNPTTKLLLLLLLLSLCSVVLLYSQLYLSLMEAPGRGTLLAPHIAQLVMESGSQQIEAASSVAQITPQVLFWDSVSQLSSAAAATHLLSCHNNDADLCRRHIRYFNFQLLKQLPVLPLPLFPPYMIGLSCSWFERVYPFEMPGI